MSLVYFDGRDKLSEIMRVKLLRKKTMDSILSFFKQKGLKWLPEHSLRFLKKIHYARYLSSLSVEEEPDLKILKYIVKPGEYALDIGANIGLYTKVLSQLVGKSGHVYCIEPIPATFDILCSNLKRLNIKNVEPMNYAISDSNKIVTMEIPEYLTGGDNYYQARIVNKNKRGKSAKNAKSIKVETITIDSQFCEIADKISFVKCDVEEHELECLRGAREFIKKSQAAWLIEVSGDPDEYESSAQHIFNTLSNLGYYSFWFDNQFLRKRKPGERASNYFFLTENHVDRIKHKNPTLFE